MRGLVRVVNFPMKSGEVPARFDDGEKSAAFHIPHHNTNVLGPGRELRFAGATRSFDPRDMAEVKRGGTKKILVAGMFYYRDVYRALHYTKYCMIYAGLDSRHHVVLQGGRRGEVIRFGSRHGRSVRH